MPGRARSVDLLLGGHSNGVERASFTTTRRPGVLHWLFPSRRSIPCRRGPWRSQVPRRFSASARCRRGTPGTPPCWLSLVADGNCAKCPLGIPWESTPAHLVRRRQTAWIKRPAQRHCVPPCRTTWTAAIGFLNRVSGVRFTPGAPPKPLVKNRSSKPLVIGLFGPTTLRAHAVLGR
jgi:hypothetical protein